jgi:YHS domain-containing protein
MFFRTILFLLLAIVVLTAIRMFAGVLTKGIGSMFDPPKTPDRPAPPGGGELKRDPVCGTFVAAGSGITKVIDGQAIHFCSTACRDKYLASPKQR